MRVCLEEHLCRSNPVSMKSCSTGQALNPMTGTLIRKRRPLRTQTQGGGPCEEWCGGCRSSPSGESESEVAQSCPTLCNPRDCSLSGSSVHGIFQARVLEWIAFPSPGDLPDPGIEPRSPVLQVDTLPSKPPGKPYIDMWTFKYQLQLTAIRNCATSND